MHNISKKAILLLLCTTLSADANDVIGKIEIPCLTDTANNVTRFTKPITPVIPVMIAGGLIAVSFNKRYNAVDITSPIRAGIFAEPSDATPRWCFSIDKKRSPEKEYMKLAGKRLFHKESNGRFILSETKEFLSAVDVLEKPSLNSSDLSLEVMPMAYLQKCPQHFSKLKADLKKSLSEGKSAEEQEKLSNQFEMVQKILEETETFNLSLSATDNYLELNSLLKPAAATALKMLISQFSTQNLSLKFPVTDDDSGDIALNKLADNIDLILKMVAPSKAMDDRKRAVFAQIMRDSSGHLTFKDNRALLNLKISQATVKKLIPERYLQRSGQRQRIQF